MVDLEKHPVLEKIVSAAMIPVELGPFLVYDLLTIPPRNWLIPRALKKKLPFFSCREYSSGFAGYPDCKPARKYYHNKLFLFRFICGSYKEGSCIKYKR